MSKGDGRCSSLANCGCSSEVGLPKARRGDMHVLVCPVSDRGDPQAVEQDLPLARAAALARARTTVTTSARIALTGN
jgi:hypothetical protein